MSWKRKILSHDEEQKIEAKIATFEKNTHSELILCIAKASDPYPGAVLRLAIFIVLALSFLASIYLEFEHSYYLVISQFVLLFPLLYLCQIPFFKKVALTKSEVNRETHEKAVEMFFTFGNSQTSHQASAMIYLSLYERKIELLIGPKLSEKISQTELNELIASMRNSFKEKKFYEGILNAIEIWEKELIEYFPEKVLQNSQEDISNQIRWVHFG